ncbi:MAG: ATP-dependent zinc protease [Desulfobacterales bacterium]|nr:MAG: ATP-dependent zinc protease [Desulfobacterales bacterium]
MESISGRSLNRCGHDLIRNMVVFSLIPFSIAGIVQGQSSGKDRLIVGWIEHVTILPENLKIKAKLDAVARTSSLNAVIIAEFKGGADKFVRFDLTNRKGRTETIEAKVIRIAKIKQHNAEPAACPVIRLGICMEKVYKEVEVNLANRSNFNYQLSIGRGFLKGEFAVVP